MKKILIITSLLITFSSVSQNTATATISASITKPLRIENNSNLTIRRAQRSVEKELFYKSEINPGIIRVSGDMNQAFNLSLGFPGTVPANSKFFLYNTPGGWGSLENYEHIIKVGTTLGNPASNSSGPVPKYVDLVLHYN